MYISGGQNFTDSFQIHWSIIGLNFSVDLYSEPAMVEGSFCIDTEHEVEAGESGTYTVDVEQEVSGDANNTSYEVPVVEVGPSSFTIEKVVLGGGADTAQEFTFEALWLEDTIVISEDSVATGWQDVGLGNLEVQETFIPEEYTFSHVTCTSDGFPMLESSVNVNAETHSVTVDFTAEAGKEIECTFYNTYTPVEPTYSFLGQKWDDTNGNGIWEEEGESALNGVDINLYFNESLFDTTTTDTYEDTFEETFDGVFLFNGLLPGNYRVCEVLPQNATQTYPTPSNYFIGALVESVTSGEGAYCYDFVIVDEDPQEVYFFGNHVTPAIEEPTDEEEPSQGGGGGSSSGGGGGGSGSKRAECGDYKDNDNDGLKDSLDPDCHTDGNASNTASYDRRDRVEADGQVLGAGTTREELLMELMAKLIDLLTQLKAMQEQENA